MNKTPVLPPPWADTIDFKAERAPTSMAIREAMRVEIDGLRKYIKWLEKKHARDLLKEQGKTVRAKEIRRSIQKSLTSAKHMLAAERRVRKATQEQEREEGATYADQIAQCTPKTVATIQTTWRFPS